MTQINPVTFPFTPPSILPYCTQILQYVSLLKTYPLHWVWWAYDPPPDLLLGDGLVLCCLWDPGLLVPEESFQVSDRLGRLQSWGEFVGTSRWHPGFDPTEQLLHGSSHLHCMDGVSPDIWGSGPLEWSVEGRALSLLHQTLCLSHSPCSPVYWSATPVTNQSYLTWSRSSNGLACAHSVTDSLLLNLLVFCISVIQSFSSPVILISVFLLPCQVFFSIPVVFSVLPVPSAKTLISSQSLFISPLFSTNHSVFTSPVLTFHLFLFLIFKLSLLAFQYKFNRIQSHKCNKCMYFLSFNNVIVK